MFQEYISAYRNPRRRPLYTIEHQPILHSIMEEDEIDSPRLLEDVFNCHVTFNNIIPSTAELPRGLESIEDDDDTISSHSIASVGFLEFISTALKCCKSKPIMLVSLTNKYLDTVESYQIAFLSQDHAF